MKPLVSIVMAVFNSEEFLEQSVGSIFAQSLCDWELILVDDGSTDGSYSLLQDFTQQDARVKLASQKNSGAGVARNLGMAMAEGKYILFLDADDMFHGEMLAVMTGEAERTAAEIVICRATCFDHETGQGLPSAWLRKDEFLEGKQCFSPEEMKNSLFQFTYGWAWDKLFSLAFLRSQELSFPQLRNSEDLCFVYLALVSANQIAVVSEELVRYRMNRSNSVSHVRNQLPTLPWDAVELLEVSLKERGVAKKYEQTFHKWLLEFFVWNVSNLSNKTIQKQECHRVKKEFFPKYAFEQYGKHYFDNNSLYCKYLLLKNAPFFLFYLVVKGYHWLKGKGKV